MRVYYYLLSLLIATLAAMMFLQIAGDKGDSHTFLLNFYSEDISLLLEAIQAAPGDITIIYPIEEGYKLKITQTAVVITHTPSGDEREKSYHRIPGIIFEEGEAEGILRLTKEQGVISLSTKLKEQTCILPTVNDLTIKITSLTPNPNADLTKKEVDLLTASYTAASKNINKDSNQETNNFANDNDNDIDNNNNNNNNLELNLIITAHKTENPGTSELLIKRRTATNQQEAIYNYIFCSYKKKIQQTNPTMNILEIEEPKAQTEKDQLIFSFSIPEEEKDQFMKERNKLTTQFTSTLTELKTKETPATSDSQKEINTGEQ